MAKIRVAIDPNACIGAATCVGVSPQLFQLDEENRANIVPPGTENGAYEATFDATAEQQNEIELAVDGCPTSAIRMERIE